MLTTTAQWLVGLVGAFGLFLGANALWRPAFAAGFGIPDTPTTDPAFRAWLQVKAARDIGTGLLILVALAAAPSSALGWFMLAAAVIPIGDALIVLHSKGPKATAYGVHAATAATILAVGVLCFVA